MWEQYPVRLHDKVVDVTCCPWINLMSDPLRPLPFRHSLGRCWLGGRVHAECGLPMRPVPGMQGWECFLALPVSVEARHPIAAGAAAAAGASV